MNLFSTFVCWLNVFAECSPTGTTGDEDVEVTGDGDWNLRAKSRTEGSLAPIWSFSGFNGGKEDEELEKPEADDSSEGDDMSEWE